MRENPEIERRVARHRALRERIKLAYSAELSEPVPERLQTAARRAPAYDGRRSVTNNTHSSHSIWRTSPKGKCGRVYLQPSSASCTR